ncbi:MAG: hypothetical protein HY796_11900 [Elusimicrobia bacterium]|nr:hypothetical protein [Elusimicrobiota bacterium]
MAKDLLGFQLRVGGKKIKLLNAIDRYASSAGRAFESGLAGLMEIPMLTAGFDGKKSK